MPLHVLPGVVRKENKGGGPPGSVVNTHMCLVVFHGMCLSAASVHGRGSSVMVCTRSLSAMQVSGAGTGRRALVHAAPLAYSVLLPPPSSGCPPSLKAPLCAAPGVSVAAVELGRSALGKIVCFIPGQGQLGAASCCGHSSGPL